MTIRTKGALVAAALCATLGANAPGAVAAGPEEYVYCTTVISENAATVHRQLVEGQAGAAVTTVLGTASDYEACAEII